MPRRVLITGASRGIGAALLAGCRARGDSVIGTARAGGEGLVALDLADPAAAGALSRAQGEAPLDLLVCNAGVLLDRGQTLEQGYDPALWAQTFAVNVTGVFLSVQAVLPNLRAAGGRIAIIASAMGSDARAPGGSYIYRASKAAALNLGRNLAADLRAQGIAVGIYHPGWVRTDMGGPGADLSAEESARGLLMRFDALTLEQSGCFEDHAGRPIPF